MSAAEHEGGMRKHRDSGTLTGRPDSASRLPNGSSRKAAAVLAKAANVLLCRRIPASEPCFNRPNAPKLLLPVPPIGVQGLETHWYESSTISVLPGDLASAVRVIGARSQRTLNQTWLIFGSCRGPIWATASPETVLVTAQCERNGAARVWCARRSSSRSNRTTCASCDIGEWGRWRCLSRCRSELSRSLPHHNQRSPKAVPLLSLTKI